MNLKSLWCSVAANSLANILKDRMNTLLWSSEFLKQALNCSISSVGKSKDSSLRLLGTGPLFFK